MSITTILISVEHPFFIERQLSQLKLKFLLKNSRAKDSDILYKEKNFQSRKSSWILKRIYFWRVQRKSLGWKVWISDEILLKMRNNYNCLTSYRSSVFDQMALLHPANELRLAAIDEQFRSMMKFKKTVTFMLQVCRYCNAMQCLVVFYITAPVPKPAQPVSLLRLSVRPRAQEGLALRENIEK